MTDRCVGGCVCACVADSPVVRRDVHLLGAQYTATTDRSLCMCVCVCVFLIQHR